MSGQPSEQPRRWIKSLTAILSFLLGSLAFSRAGRALSPLRRGTMLASFGAQALLVLGAAALVQSGLVPAEASGAGVPPALLLPLAMLAFQSAGQIVASRFLALGEVPTVVLTSTYCDLMFDPHAFAAGEVKRNRRLASVAMLVAGAMAGGALTKGHGGIAVALWVAGGLKVAFVLAWALWKVKAAVRLE